MKTIIKLKPFYILITVLFCSLNSYSQSKLVLAFTKKKQMVVLNHKIDSLKSLIVKKDSTILGEQNKLNLLQNEMNKKSDVLNSTNQKVSFLEEDLLKTKTALDSLHKVNTESQAYSLFQRNEDSLRYQNLLRKLSDRNTFIVDSLKSTQNIKKNKQDPTKVETYYYKDFKSVITGTPDEKNRYTYTFELFQKNGEEYVKADNSAPFNDNKQLLLDIINKKIQKDFNASYKIDPKCFTSKTPPIYDFKKLGIEFKDGKINFYAVFDFTTENCYYLYGYTSVEFTVDELKAYLK